MTFYRRILRQIIDPDLFTKNITIDADDILLNQKINTILYIMKENDLFETKSITCGLFSITEKELVKQFEITKPTNNQVYDFIMYLNSIGELKNYLLQDFKIIPDEDVFYGDINELLDIKTNTVKNYDKICPSCNLIPEYDFDEICDYCKYCKTHNTENI